MTYLTENIPWWLDIARILLAGLLGVIIGWQREHHGREAGIRTYMAASLGACAFGLVSNAIGDQGRISAGIVTGVGFIGAGIILRDAGRVTGLTTAATLWASAAVGLSAAYGIYRQSARNLAPWKLELTSLSRDFRFDAAFERPNEPAAQSVL